MSVHVEHNGLVTTIILSRPEVRNAVNPITAEALRTACLNFNADPDAEVAVLTGAGGYFCAGYDLKHAGDSPPDMLDSHDVPADWDGGLGDDIPGGPMGPSRLHLDKPIIAAIEGPAVAGGMELALWCDMRVMAKDAYMGVYCRRWGVPLIDGGTVRLPRIVGMGRAMDLILTGRKADADECERIGLCERVVAPGQARAAAEELAREIARFPQACMRADRRSAYAQWPLSEAQALHGEWASKHVFKQEGAAGAARFASGKGRGGDFGKI